jgi:hypothetical protein
MDDKKSEVVEAQDLSLCAKDIVSALRTFHAPVSQFQSQNVMFQVEVEPAAMQGAIDSVQTYTLTYLERFGKPQLVVVFAEGYEGRDGRKYPQGLKVSLIGGHSIEFEGENLNERKGYVPKVEMHKLLRLWIQTIADYMRNIEPQVVTEVAEVAEVATQIEGAVGNAAAPTAGESHLIEYS